MPGSSSTSTGPSPSAEARYTLDAGWHAERERLASLTQLYDDTTLRIATQLGLTTGWRCAEVGGGTGSVAQLLASAVGPQGHVLAVDIDTRFLEPLADATLDVRSQDIAAQPLPAGQFDLVHARLVLEHLPSREDVLRGLATALVPGGWLLIEDFDWATSALVDPPSPVYERVAAACLTVLEAHGYDRAFGRRLPRALRAAGLLDVGTFAASAQVDADPARGIPQWDLMVEQLTPALLGAALVTQDDLREFSDLMHDGATVVFAPLLVSSWGRAPASGMPAAG